MMVKEDDQNMLVHTMITKTNKTKGLYPGKPREGRGWDAVR
jgi:hypothetical protein